MSDVRGWTKQITMTADQVGFNAKAINSAADGNILDVAGYNQITIELTYAQNAGSGFTFQLETFSDDDYSGTTPYVWQALEDSGSGTHTAYDRTVTKASAGGGNYRFNFKINAQRLRLGNVVATGSPDADDTLTARFLLGSI